jgi:hypothetical protein
VLSPRIFLGRGIFQKIDDVHANAQDIRLLLFSVQTSTAKAKKILN